MTDGYELIDRSQVLPALVADGARRHGGRVFLHDVAGAALTYAATHDAALRWAGALAGLGVDRGDRVVTMLPPGLESTPIWLGLGWLGAVDTGVNTDYLGTMLRYVVDNAQARVAVVHADYLDRMRDAVGGLQAPPAIVVVGGEGGDGAVSATSLLAGATPPADLSPPEPWDIACMIYTSGTTGPSKGVLIPWAQLHAMTVGIYPPDDMDADEAFYAPFAMYHVSGRLPPYTMALCGGRVVLRERLSATSYWSDIRELGCTTAILAAGVVKLAMDAEPSADDAAHPLRRAIIGPVPPDIDDFAQRFGVKVATAFNMTEISGATWAGWKIDNPQSCGRAREGYPGYELRIVDEHDLDVPVGQVGELIVRTAVPWTLNAGYFADPAKTAEAWRNGWFHTGDAFRRDAEGNYFLVDRIKDCIRRRGENISSFEVESHVTEHPGVAECAAIAVPDPREGDEVKVVVVPRPDATVDPAGLIEFLQGRMPRFMIPRYVEIVDALPKTDATMKVRKVELRRDPLNAATWDREQAGIVLRR